MADWSKPALTDTYTNFLQYLKDRDTDNVLWFEGITPTNTPTGAKRLNIVSGVGTFQRWSGTAWADAASTFSFPALTVIGSATLAATAVTTLTASDVVTMNGGILQLASATPAATGNAFIYRPATATLAFGTNNAEAMRIDSAGRVLVATTSPQSDSLGSQSFLQMAGDSVTRSTLILQRFTANNGGATLSLGKSRGATVGTQTRPVDADNLGSLRFDGSNGTSMVAGALISAVIKGTPSATSMPTNLVFSTTAVGSTTPTDRVWIDTAGNTGFGAAPGAYKVDVTGDINYTGTLYNSGTAVVGLTGGQTGTAPTYAARSWVNFNGTGSTGANQTIRASGNVSSVSKAATGDYTINFTTAMANANYSVVASQSYLVSTTPYVAQMVGAVTYNTGSVRILDQAYNGAATDSNFINVAIFR